MTTSFTELSLTEARGKYPLYPIQGSSSIPDLANINLQSDKYADSVQKDIVATDMVDQIAVFTVEKTGNSIHRIHGCQFSKDASEGMILYYLDIYVLKDCDYDVYIVARSESANQLLERIKIAIQRIFAKAKINLKEFINSDKTYKYETAILTKQGEVTICKHEEKYVRPEWGISP